MRKRPTRRRSNTCMVLSRMFRMLARSTSWPRTLRTISRMVFAGTQIVPCRWCLREGTPSSTGVSTGSVRFGRRSKVFLLQRT
ncbi:unnamed protein product [Pylaiella littoralis]